MARDHLKNIVAQAFERLDVTVPEPDLSLIEGKADHVLHAFRKPVSRTYTNLSKSGVIEP